MSVHGLTFKLNGNNIYAPLGLSGTPIEVSVTNYGEDDLEGLGLFVISSTSVGDVDHPADYPPETDLQDLLEWGTASDLGLAVQGGLKLSVPQEDGSTLIEYVRRDKGSTLNNKIPFKGIAAGDTVLFTMTLETPPSVSARRLFIDLRLE